MYREKERWKQNPRLIVKAKDFNAPLRWREGRLIFTCSWSDFFISEADEYRADAWKVIRATPQHTWIILTKRAERIKDCLPPDWGPGGYNYPHVRLLVSVESPAYLNRIDMLLNDVPAMVKGVSFEPLLERIPAEKLSGYFDWTRIAYRNAEGQLFFSEEKMPQLQWAIIGGESGFKTGRYTARDCKEEWIREIAEACLTKGIACFVKQMGSVIARAEPGRYSDFAGAVLEELPEDLKLANHPDDAKITGLYKKYMDKDPGVMLQLKQINAKYGADLGSLTTAGKPAIIKGDELAPDKFFRV